MIAPDPLQSTLRIGASGRYVFLTIVVAYGIYLLPWFQPFLRPNLPLIVLLHWCLYESRRVGHTNAFILGLLVDIADGSLFGLNALAYTVVLHLTQLFRVRILKFNLWQQALHVLALLLIGQLIVMFLNAFQGNATAVGPIYFLTSVVGAALWPIIYFLLEVPRQRFQAEELQ
jgi:rod shape-determining protein MreD